MATAVESTNRLAYDSASIFSFLAASYTSSEPPPSYHTEDRLGPPPHWHCPQTWATIPQLRALTVRDDTVQLTIDKSKIYHSSPSNVLYRLPRALTWSGNDITLFRSSQATTPGMSRNQLLYNMRRIPFTQTISLETTRAGLSSATMRGRKSLRNVMHWEVNVTDDAKTVLHYYKGKWKNQNGDLIAQERAASGSAVSIKIVFENLRHRLDLIDLIVAASTARTWQSNAPWCRNPALYWADSKTYEEKSLMVLPIVYLFQAVTFRKLF